MVYQKNIVEPLSLFNFLPFLAVAFVCSMSTYYTHKRVSLLGGSFMCALYNFLYVVPFCRMCLVYWIILVPTLNSLFIGVSTSTPFLSRPPSSNLEPPDIPASSPSNLGLHLTIRISSGHSASLTSEPVFPRPTLISFPPLRSM